MKNTKDLLMQAAAKLIREAGYAGMTTAAVARLAQVSEGTIYRYFPSKEALAESVFADIWNIFIQYMEAHLPPREMPVDRLEAFLPVTIAALDALMPKYGDLSRQEHLYFASKHSGCVSLPPGCRDYVGLLEEAIRLAKETGRVRKEIDPAVAAAFFFFGTGDVMDLYGDVHCVDRTGPRIPENIQEQLNLLMRGALYDEK